MVIFNRNTPEKKLTCTFTGRLDTNACLQIADEITNKMTEIKDPATDLPNDYHIIFDLKEVNYISSSYIRICVNTAKKAEKGKFCIINSDPFIKKTFKIAGLDEMLNVS